MPIKKIIIIGGGISGLATAYSLEKRAEKEGKSVSIILLEKKNRIGGNILTERAGDFLIEGGPDCFLSEKPWAIRLCKELGMDDSLLCTNDKFRKTFILWKGRLHEMSEGIILMIPTRFMPVLKDNLISFPGKLRMAMDLFLTKRKMEEDESLSEFVRHHFGQEVLDKIAEPLVAGVHAGNPDTMSVKSTFPKFVQLEEEYGSLIKGMIVRRKMMLKQRQSPFNGDIHTKYTMFMTLKNGLAELPAALAKKLKMTVVLSNKEALEVNNTVSNTGQAPVYNIYLNNDESLNADAIIFAAPSYETAKLLNKFDSSISELLNKIPYVSTATVSVAYKKDSISHPMNGFGFVIPKLEKRKIMAATWVSKKFLYRSPDDHVLIRCFIGGSNNEELVFLDDREMINIVKEELKDIMGIDANPVLTRIYRWQKAMPQYTIGHDDRLSTLNDKLLKHSGIFITGSAYTGIGISDCIKNADITAESVLEYLKTAYESSNPDT